MKCAKTFYFRHQFDPMNRERATAVLIDFWKLIISGKERKGKLKTIKLLWQLQEKGKEVKSTMTQLWKLRVKGKSLH